MVILRVKGSMEEVSVVVAVLAVVLVVGMVVEVVLVEEVGWAVAVDWVVEEGSGMVFIRRVLDMEDWAAVEG